MSWNIHISGHVTDPEAAAIEGALFAKFTAALLEIRHVKGNGLTDAYFYGSHVSGTQAGVTTPGAVAMDEQNAHSIVASRATVEGIPAPGAVSMEEQGAESIAASRYRRDNWIPPGSVVTMDEQSAESIAASRAPKVVAETVTQPLPVIETPVVPVVAPPLSPFGYPIPDVAPHPDLGLVGTKEAAADRTRSAADAITTANQQAGNIPPTTAQIAEKDRQSAIKEMQPDVASPASPFGYPISAATGAHPDLGLVGGVEATVDRTRAESFAAQTQADQATVDPQAVQAAQIVEKDRQAQIKAGDGVTPAPLVLVSPDVVDAPLESLPIDGAIRGDFQTGVRERYNAETATWERQRFNSTSYEWETAPPPQG